MAAISMNNVIYFGNYEWYNLNYDLLLYILELLNWEKNYWDSHKVGVHTMLGVFVWKWKTFPWVLSYCPETLRCRRFKVPIDMC